MSDKGENNKPKLLDQVRRVLRLKHYSLRTEESYVDWIRRYILFHQKRDPKDLGAEDIREFLTHRSADRNVSSSTQNQALSGLLFLYKEFLGVALPWVDDYCRETRSQRVATRFGIRSPPICWNPVTISEPERLQREVLH